MGWLLKAVGIFLVAGFPSAQIVVQARSPTAPAATPATSTPAAPAPAAGDESRESKPSIAAMQVGDRLPPLAGEFLTGRKAVLPDVARGKVVFVAMGFSYGSRFAVEEWAKWFRDSFSGLRDVTFFEVPMIGGMARMGRWFIDSGMRKGTPAELHENVITVYGGTGDWKKRMGYRDEKASYLLILDKEGIVRWRYSGAYDDKVAREVDRVVRSLSEPVS